MDSGSEVSQALEETDNEDKIMTIRPEFSFHRSHDESKENDQLSSELRFLPPYDEVSQNRIESTCSRCKKLFQQDGDKLFKTCLHCRELQRQRSRRWQIRTKEKDGHCTRCGIVIPEDQIQFVLCPNCRKSLRSKKATRGMQGKCVHCSGPLEMARSKFKVCARCRRNDRIRRQNLESNGFCIRCAKSLANENGKSKICKMCRDRRNNPNFLPNARIPNILNVSYFRQESENLLETKVDEDTFDYKDHDKHTDDDDVLHAAQLMIPSYSNQQFESRITTDAVNATLALVLTLADDNNLLEGNYFSVDNKN